MLRIRIRKARALQNWVVLYHKGKFERRAKSFDCTGSKGTRLLKRRDELQRKDPVPAKGDRRLISFFDAYAAGLSASTRTTEVGRDSGCQAVGPNRRDHLSNDRPGRRTGRDSRACVSPTARPREIRAANHRKPASAPAGAVKARVARLFLFSRLAAESPLAAALSYGQGGPLRARDQRRRIQLRAHTYVRGQCVCVPGAGHKPVVGAPARSSHCFFLCDRACLRAARRDAYP